GEDFLVRLHQAFQQLEITARHEQFQAELVEVHAVAQGFHQLLRLVDIRQIERDDESLARRDVLGGKQCLCHRSVLHERRCGDGGLATVESAHFSLCRGEGLRASSPAACCRVCVIAAIRETSSFRRARPTPATPVIVVTTCTARCRFSRAKLVRKRAKRVAWSLRNTGAKLLHGTPTTTQQEPYVFAPQSAAVRRAR